VARVDEWDGIGRSIDSVVNRACFSFDFRKKWLFSSDFSLLHCSAHAVVRDAPEKMLALKFH
jgi:hypothetical protein